MRGLLCKAVVLVVLVLSSEAHTIAQRVTHDGERPRERVSSVLVRGGTVGLVGGAREIGVVGVLSIVVLSYFLISHYHSARRVAFRSAACASEMAHKTRKYDTLFGGGWNDKSILKPCEREWTDSRNQEWLGCVPGLWAGVAHSDLVCATAVDADGKATEIGDCIKCEPCACTQNGWSGEANTGIKGCDAHINTQYAQYAKFCYVTGGTECKDRGVVESTLFPGAAYRDCDGTDVGRIEVPEGDGGGVGEGGMSFFQSWRVLVVLAGYLALVVFPGVQELLFERRAQVESKQFIQSTNPNVQRNPDASLSSLTSREWQCAPGHNTCNSIATLSVVDSTVPNCADRFAQVVPVRLGQSRFTPQTHTLELQCSESCQPCPIAMGWVPVQVTGKVRTVAANCEDENACPKVRIRTSDESGQLNQEDDLFLSVGATTQRDAPVLDLSSNHLLFSEGINAATGTFHVTVPVYISSLMRSPIVQIEVTAADQETRKTYSLYAPDLYPGEPM